MQKTISKSSYEFGGHAGSISIDAYPDWVTLMQERPDGEYDSVEMNREQLIELIEHCEYPMRLNES